MRVLSASIIALALLASSQTAFAEDGAGNVIEEWGLNVSAGGGVADFAKDDMRGMTGTAGAWDARVVFGTRKYIGVEAGYIGTVQSIDALGLDADAKLLGSGADAALRLHMLPGSFQPYAFIGAGWKHYDLTSADTNTSSVVDGDDVFEVPVGLGFAYTYEHLMVDVRGSYRTTLDADLLPATHQTGEPNLDTFQLTARVGWAF